MNNLNLENKVGGNPKERLVKVSFYITYAL